LSNLLTAAPEALAAASADLSGIGDAIRRATTAAAPASTDIEAAAADDVSRAIARIFGGYGQSYQAMSAQAALFHEQFVASRPPSSNP
jgi:hypothetical protein